VSGQALGDLSTSWSGTLADARGRWSWVAREPIGLLLGLLGAALLTVAVYLLNQWLMTLPSPAFVYTLPVLGVTFVWGWRVGAATALAALLGLWYVVLPPAFSFALQQPGEWTRLVLAAVTYAALIAAGEAVRRLRRGNAGLARAVEQLDAVIGSMADGVLITDRDGNLLRTNEAMRRIVGGEVPCSRVERNARWQTRWGDGTPIAPGTGPVSRALAGEVMTGVGMSVRHAAGHEVQLSVSGAPLWISQGGPAGAVIVCRDVTELRRLEQARRDFLSVASHELKTPLTSLSGYTQLFQRHLGRSGAVDERSARYLAAIATQTQRMTELVETLLDVSRIETGHLRPRREDFELTSLVREVVEETSDLSDRHTISLAGDPPPIAGHWDRHRVEQVLVNLLSNAVRYSPDGGLVVVTVGRRERDGTVPGRDAGTDGQEPSAYACVSVRDSGIGLKAEQLPLVFERFHQAHAGDARDPLTRGMGLGLYIAREIVEQHGGRIWAESPGSGRGATFTFTLPLSPPAVGGEEPV
jgi:signal transduction histidine kinase